MSGARVPKGGEGVTELRPDVSKWRTWIWLPKVVKKETITRTTPLQDQGAAEKKNSDNVFGENLLLSTKKGALCPRLKKARVSREKYWGRKDRKPCYEV